ncbi:MAG: (2Fe-2S)-binding protein, partial [Verrucomicrobiae bacterium]|nr:(2Fe-2S)-binding protein [Verrucomicrobiae bacterium]
MSDAAPPAPMIRLTVDGRVVEVPKGANVIQAASALGIHVPHYCWHEKLSVSGNCRMCLVEVGLPRLGTDRKPVIHPDGAPEINWMPRPQIGCATAVAEGMAVRTNSRLVEDCRRGVMEFLLLNHPLDCPICDKAGECHLQQYSVEYGAGRSRFVDEKERKPKRVRLGPRIMLDDERCILCSRCIRFCREIAKDDVLGFFNRGGHTFLGCYPGQDLANNYSLNTVDLCPVGALTSTDFRFKMRVWFLKETDSVCSSCARGCNLTVGAREGVIHRFTPRRNDAVNSDWMCDAGRLNFRWVHDARRLREPVRAGAGGTAWEDALGACRRLLEAAR